ncbi:CoA transferase [Mesorhizobium sp.]|uniref:CoA transferase n=1 Tax=Mesorhizobium sp. TaxID=1871066 RepID=UPI003427D3A6
MRQANEVLSVGLSALRSEAHRAVLKPLIAAADIFIQNLKPGSRAASKNSVSGSLRRRVPPLITCDISGFGHGGPFSHRKAYDLIVQAETGNRFVGDHRFRFQRRDSRRAGVIYD